MVKCRDVAYNVSTFHRGGGDDGGDDDGGDDGGDDDTDDDADDDNPVLCRPRCQLIGLFLIYRRIRSIDPSARITRS